MVLPAIIITIIGIVVLLGGIVLLLYPRWLIRLNEKFQRPRENPNQTTILYSADDQIYSNRYIFGILFILIGIYILFSGMRII